MNLKKSDIFSLSVFLVLLIGSNYLNKKYVKPLVKIDKQESAININEDLVQVFAFGNQRLLSSLLWVQTLLESDHDHYKSKDLNSWMYLRFNSIINLDPKFYEAYKIGGQYLSVIKDDDLGAVDILLRGQKQFPDDFWMNFFLGFQYYYELFDTENALKYFEKVEKHRETFRSYKFLPSVISRIRASGGDLKSAFILMYASYQNLKHDEKLSARYKKSLYAIKAEIDLECLNKSSNQNCQRVDFNNKPYVLKNGEYVAIEEWKPFRASKKRGGSSPPQSN